MSTYEAQEMTTGKVNDAETKLYDNCYFWTIKLCALTAYGSRLLNSIIFIFGKISAL